MFFPENLFQEKTLRILLKKDPGHLKKWRECPSKEALESEKTWRKVQASSEKQTPRLIQLLDPPAFQPFFARACCLLKTRQKKS